MTQDIYSALSMTSFGINTVVITKHTRFDWYLNEYATQKDKKFGGGLGKKELLKRLEQLLPVEDKYFDLNPDQAVSTNQRWLDFCEDCIILATLSAFLKNKKIYLLHPESFNPNRGLNSQYEKIESELTYIQEIPSLN